MGPKTSDNNLCWLGLHAVQDCGTRVCLVVWYTSLGPWCASCALSYARVCVCVCVCVCVRAYVCAYVCACERARRVIVCIRACCSNPSTSIFIFLVSFVLFLFAQSPREGYVHTVSTSVDRCSIKLFVSKLIRILYLIRLLLVLFHFFVVVEISFSFLLAF